MKVIVCLKQVPARDAPLRIETGAAWISEADATFETNEADRHAVETALQLKDVNGGEVVVLSIGPKRVVQSLRDALAKGADRAIHILDTNPAIRDPLEIASLLAVVAGEESFDLILTGLQSDDSGYGQTGAILAELLGLPHAGLVTSLRFETSGLTVTQELGGGWLQDVALPLPALLTIQAGINKPRYAGMKGIMAAKRKPIRTIAVSDIKTAGQRACQEAVNLYLPPTTKAIELLAGTPTDIAKQLYTRLAPLLSGV